MLIVSADDSNPGFPKEMVKAGNPTVGVGKEGSKQR